MAASEPDPRLARVYANLAAMEEAHVAFWEDRLRKAGASAPPRRPSWRSRVLGGIARRFGPELVLATIAANEEVDQNVYVKQPETRQYPDARPGTLACQGAQTARGDSASWPRWQFLGSPGRPASIGLRKCPAGGRVDKTSPDPRAALVICPRGIAPSRSHRRRARHGRHAGRFRQESDSGQGSRLL